MYGLGFNVYVKALIDLKAFSFFGSVSVYTRDVFYVRRKVDLMKTAKVNAYIMHISGKIELLSIHAA